MKKYESIINSINKSIIEFNKILKDSYSIATLDNGNFEDIDKFTQLQNKELYQWGKIAWPNHQDRGVYFLFEYKKDSSQDLGLYIGKASMEAMGHRIYSHLTKYKNKEEYLDNKKGEIYVIEMLSTVSVSNKGVNMDGIASALEEHLINDLSNRGINLINKVGV